MNNIKTDFSIKDLENLSGIKAHTIRIWEKRYNLLSPNRTDTNIRTYDEKSLQKLLNVSFLNNNGYKISKIAKLPEVQIHNLVEKISMGKGNDDHAINEMKIAMLNFDQKLFIETYNQLSETRSFEQIFNEIIIPLFEDIGLLWQTNTITPANEHFISALIRQKLLINIESLQINIDYNTTHICVLFLPENEIHELGLMFIQYLLLKQGIYSIYLGQSVPMDGLKDLVKNYQSITFISYFTVMPETDKIESYLKTFSEEILSGENYKFWVLGRKLNEVANLEIPKNVKILKSIEAFKKMAKGDFKPTTDRINA